MKNPKTFADYELLYETYLVRKEEEENRIAEAKLAAFIATI